MYWLTLACRWLAYHLDGLNDDYTKVALILRNLNPPEVDGDGVQFMYAARPGSSEGPQKPWGNRRFSRYWSHVSAEHLGDLQIPADDRQPNVSVIFEVRLSTARITETVDVERIVLDSLLLKEN